MKFLKMLWSKLTKPMIFGLSILMILLVFLLWRWLRKNPNGVVAKGEEVVKNTAGKVVTAVNNVGDKATDALPIINV